MLETLRKNRWALMLSGVVQAAIAVIYFAMTASGEAITFHAWANLIVLSGVLAIAAGVCSTIAGLGSSHSPTCWTAIVNGTALIVLGVITAGLARHYRISFLTIAILIAVMAASVALLELKVGSSLRRFGQSSDARILLLAAVASAAFLISFLALGFKLMRVPPGSHADLFWLGSYFGFTALSMIAVARHLGRRQHLIAT